MKIKIHEKKYVKIEIHEFFFYINIKKQHYEFQGKK